MAVELWTAGVNIPGKATEQARQATADGYDGISMGDTVTLGGDPYVGLTAAAFASPTLKLLVGVTNSVTRHPALTAAWATDSVLQAQKAFEGLTFKGSTAHRWTVRFADRAGYRSMRTDLQRQQLVKAGAHLAQLLAKIWPDHP